MDFARKERIYYLQAGGYVPAVARSISKNQEGQMSENLRPDSALGQRTGLPTANLVPHAVEKVLARPTRGEIFFKLRIPPRSIALCHPVRKLSLLVLRQVLDR